MDMVVAWSVEGEISWALRTLTIGVQLIQGCTLYIVGKAYKDGQIESVKTAGMLDL